MFNKRVIGASSLVFTAIVMLLATLVVAALSPCSNANRFCTHRELTADLDVRNW
jgi:hypothetical protein